jgi:hypothetical protein
MPPINDDYPLQVLLEVMAKEKLGSEAAISASLVRDLYAIQKKYQFDLDTDIAASEMRKRVEAEVDQARKELKK